MKYHWTELLLSSCTNKNKYKNNLSCFSSSTPSPSSTFRPATLWVWDSVSSSFQAPSTNQNKKGSYTITYIWLHLIFIYVLATTGMSIFANWISLGLIYQMRSLLHSSGLQEECLPTPSPQSKLPPVHSWNPSACFTCSETCLLLFFHLAFLLGPYLHQKPFLTGTSPPPWLLITLWEWE